MTRLPRTDGEATRARILQAAGTLIARNGFAATTSKAIAALAEVDLASINYHFDGRDGLHQAALAEAHRHFIDEAELQALADSDLSAPDKLRALLRQLVGKCASADAADWHGRALIRELGSPALHVLAMLQGSVQAKARIVLGILSDITGIPPDDPALLRCGVSVIAPLVVLTLSTVGLPGPAQQVRDMPHEAIAEHMHRFALAGLQAEGQAWAAREKDASLQV